MGRQEDETRKPKPAAGSKKAAGKKNAGAAKPKTGKADRPDAGQQAEKERRRAERVHLPDTSDVDDVRLDPKAQKKRFSFNPFKKPVPKDLDVSLEPCPPGTKAEEKKPSFLKRLLGLGGAERTCKEAESEFGLTFTPEAHSPNDVHQSIAVELPGLAAGVNELKKAVRVKDISATGIGLAYAGPRVKAGTELTMLLATKTKKLTTNLRARVVRHSEGVLGAQFMELTRQQELLLSKLVLEGQKRSGRLKKKRELPKEIQNIKI